MCLIILFGVSQGYAVEVEILTKDGRELTGQIDNKTNDHSLWIRQQESQIVLTTAIAWTDVSEARLDGEAVQTEVLAASVPELATEGPIGFLAEPIEIQLLEASLGQVPTAVHKPIVPSELQQGPVVALEVEAFLVNLDRDVEPDGLELLVSAVDAYGHSVPVRGNIQARLLGDRDAGQVGRVRFEEMQRWGQPVRKGDFIDGVASYLLRFRNVRPEFDFDLMPVALLNVRLGVYGVGNFEASTQVIIREFNPYRDRMQLYEGSRFFRDELSDQVRRRRLAPQGSGVQAWRRR